jgi:predicted permease
MGTAWRELRQGLRSLGKSPGFTAAAVLSLALGIGANTTIFTLINAVLLRALPVKDPSRLVSLFTVDSRTPGSLLSSYPNYRDYRDHSRVFSSVALYTTVRMCFTNGGDPVEIMGQLASGNYFSTLGIKPAVGRFFGEEEDRAPGAAPVVVLSYGFWERHFGKDREIVGKTVRINGHPFTAVGVAPREFHGLNALLMSDAWMPAMMYQRVLPNPAWMEQRLALLFSVFGRLNPGTDLRHAEAAMRVMAQQLQQQHPVENGGRSLKLEPLSAAAIHPNLRGNLSATGAVLMLVAGLVLLIACANVANLLLVRASGRSREIAIRQSLGATRWKLMRQLLLEGTVLAIVAGACSLVLAHWARAVLWAARPPLLNSADFHADLDARVLGFTLGVSVLTGLLFSLAPAFQATRTSLAAELKERTGQAPSPGRARSRSLLVIAEVALSLVALVGAGLFLRSLRVAENFDPGFHTGGIVLVGFNLPGQTYDEARGREFQRLMLERASSTPGIAAASLAVSAPFGGGFSRIVFVEGDEQAAGGRGRVVLSNAVGPGYLRAIGIPLVRGRDFGSLEGPGAPRVAIVNEAMAKRCWPNQDPIGRRLRFSGDPTPLQVVGVARDANYLAIGEDPQAMVYTLMQQAYSAFGVVLARAAGDPEHAAAALRREIQVLDRNLLLTSRTLPQMIHDSLWARRLAGGLLGVFGLMALLLAMVGIYGVVSYSVSQRVREIGVRLAMGATPAAVERLILGEGIKLIGSGVALGTAVALACARAVESLLLAVDARDATTFVLVPGILTLVGLVACWFPAWRAARIDPALALRRE